MHPCLQHLDVERLQAGMRALQQSFIAMGMCGAMASERDRRAVDEIVGEVVSVR